MLIRHARLFDRLAVFMGFYVLGAGGEGRDSGLVALMGGLGLEDAEQIDAFLDYTDRLGGVLGVKLSGDLLPEGALPASADPVETLAAATLFSGAELSCIQGAGGDPVAWMRALVQISQAARARGDDSVLALESQDHDERSVVVEAVGAGMTPAGLVAHAAELAGVACGDLVFSVGADAVPADLLGADAKAAQHLAAIRTGEAYSVDDSPARLSTRDAVAVLRALVSAQPPLGSMNEMVACVRQLVAAGASSAEQVLELYALARGGTLDMSLVRRAAVEGLEPQQWVPMVTAIGASARGVYGQQGLLPLRTLAEAAEAGVSVGPWDDNIRLRGQSSLRSARERLGDRPWSLIYPDWHGDGWNGRVVELAVARVSPALVAECYAFFSRTAPGGEPGWSTPVLVDDIVALRRAGLTVALATELNRTLRGEQPIVMTVAAVLRALSLGVGADDIRRVRARVGGPGCGPALIEALEKAGVR